MRILPAAKTLDAPFVCPVMTVRPEWIDYNDHLNVAYYTLIFDQSAEAACELLGLGEDYRRAEDKTLMTAESHINYVREIKLGSDVHSTFRLLDADAKRLHVYQELYHAEGWLAATYELMILHIDLGAEGGPKVARMSETAQADVQAMLAAHRDLPRTKYMGRVIGIRR